MGKPLKFNVGFWHPFGPHGDETPIQIIERKKKEIKNNNGWTFWSFQNRSEETLSQWFSEIKQHKGPIFVVCSDSKGTQNPKGAKFYAKQFSYVMSNKWENIPSTIKIPHPFGKKLLACVFKVKNIIDKSNVILPKGVKWLCLKDRKWREDNLPTRGEYLLKTGGMCKLRKNYWILELIFPYIAVIKK
jgi:hypothetical protein